MQTHIMVCEGEFGWTKRDQCLGEAVLLLVCFNFSPHLHTMRATCVMLNHKEMTAALKQAGNELQGISTKVHVQFLFAIRKMQ